jgi:hypothetical protein
LKGEFVGTQGLSELRQFFAGTDGHLPPERARMEFVLRRAGITAMAVKIARDMRKFKGENLTLHPGCVSVLGKGILLVSPDQVHRYHPDLYAVRQMAYWRCKGRRHAAYWVEPKEGI